MKGTKVETGLSCLLGPAPLSSACSTVASSQGTGRDKGNCLTQRRASNDCLQNLLPSPDLRQRWLSLAVIEFCGVPLLSACPTPAQKESQVV